MLTNQRKLQFERKKTELKLGEEEIAKIVGQTAGEAVRDATIKAATEAAYQAGNQTNKIVEIGEKVTDILAKGSDAIDGGTALVGGTESSRAIANIAFKTTKDMARGDKVCTGLCLVSATCETVALGCSTMKFIPCRGRLYIASKIVSKGCMTWRNACAGEGC